jgi:protein O-GlcNAc transferase
MISQGDPSDLKTALLLQQRGQVGRAADIYREILARNPDDASALHHLGLLEARAGKFERAISLIVRSLELQPFNAQFRENYATILCEARRFESAAKICDDGLRSDPANVYLLYISAIALFKLKRLPDSLQRFDKLLAVQPDHLVAINERGSVLAQMKDYNQALAAFEKAISLNPKFTDAHLNMGNVLGALNRSEEAKSSFQKALALNPKLARAWTGLGNILRKHKFFDEALAAFNKALTSEPDLAAAWLGRGNVYTELKQYDDAFAAYDRALSLEPDLAEAWFGRGNVYTQLKQYDDAFADYDRACTLSSNLNYAEGARLHLKMHLCDWVKIEREVVEVLSAVRDQKPVSAPFTLLSIPASSADQLQCAKTFVADHGSFSALWRGEINAHHRIRTGYFAADFRDHALAQLAVGLFEHHDKSRFEITAISFGPDDGSDLRSRIRSAADNFIDARAMSDPAVAEFIRRHEIDILVDLTGFTQNNRFSVFARRAAPLQVNFLCYTGTMGADCIDYIIADPIVIPKDHFAFYSEQVVWLPDTYQANDDKTKISERVPTRAECGLPESAFVFCCFNNTYKINPQMFDVWMRLLAAKTDGVLWLLGANPTAERNLRREAERRGIATDRLIFAPRIALADHLARHRQADLFLDTMPYNAHTTASDALRAGLPLVTCLGETFAGRVAASLLQAVGIPEMITASLGDYEALALKLANDPALLATIKAKLARNRETFPLFDTARFTRHIEAAYVSMWERHKRGDKPKAFAVERDH